MEFTLAVVGGFRDEIRQKVLGFDPEVSILPAYDPDSQHNDEFIDPEPALMSLINAELPQSKAALALRRPVVLKTDSNFEALYVTAFDPEAHDYSFEKSCVIAGTWPDFSVDSTRNQIVISQVTASALGLRPGDRPMLYFVNDGAQIRARRVSIAAVFSSHMDERDRTTAYASMPMLQSVSGIGHTSGSVIELRGIGADSAAAVGERLQASIVRAWQEGGVQHLYPVDNVQRSGAIYLNWLDLLDTNVVVIFILMSLVAASTLIAGLFILVLDHIPTIGVLRSLGATRRTVRSIFILMALRLVGKGLIFGNILGLGLLLLQKYFWLVPLNPEMYYLDHVPVSLDWWSMLLLNVCVVLVSWLVLVLPSRIAAGVDPARTMRYE
ncbi:MAG: FtsX-like permease family protein [Muribaculaceae bacterium]|nr:FtsX-like permease family protein [Muribaculaceae bacterium]